ncbi:MAG: TIGR01906 family membrane protein, partial [Chloroflexi bacterium]|nr:TIGR01906 family membrane protein [Chloroflexota bacterium]
MYITTNARIAISSVNLYEYGYDKYNVSESTNISEKELTDIAKELISYFNSGKDITTTRFNDRELTHLQDVRNLIQFIYMVQIIVLFYVIAYIILGFIFRKKVSELSISRGLLWGSCLCIGILFLLGIMVISDFESIFTWFHEVSFNNQLWMMLPGDLLPDLYTEGFFADAALFIFISIVVECLIIGGASFIFIRRKKSGMT